MMTYNPKYDHQVFTLELKLKNKHPFHPIVSFLVSLLSLFVILSVHLSFNLSVCLSLHLPIYLSIDQSV